MTFSRVLGIVVGSVLVLGAVLGAVAWVTLRVNVPPDHCLVLIRKTGAPLPPGAAVAEPGQKGIQRDALGPGRYFLNPLVWDHELVPLTVISAGDPATWGEDYDPKNPDYQTPMLSGQRPEVGVLVQRVGKPSPDKDEVVGPEYQGIQRRVLTPGVYRINPYVYEVKKHPATVVPLGSVGVVTSRLGEMPGVETTSETVVAPDGTTTAGQPKVVQKLADDGQRGVLRHVLQPGTYYLNPYEKKVSIVWVGYNLMSQLKQMSGEHNEAIAFPSQDGFNVQIDITVVWGLHPEHVPAMINRVGEVDRIKQIILGQIRSICRNVGSNFKSTDFIQGERREEYQREVTSTLRNVCAQRDIEILIALIQNIEVRGGTAENASTSTDLRRTIQRSFIAKEQDLTMQARRETAKIRAELEAAKAEIPVARETVSADTKLKVAGIKAEADKKAQEIDAQRDLEVAQIERQVAELEAEATRVLGKARADVDQLLNAADADGKRMMIEAFGSGRAYNLYTFAEHFAPDSVQLFFAGEGTFWTDLSRLQDAAALRVLESQKPTGAAAPKP